MTTENIYEQEEAEEPRSKHLSIELHEGVQDNMRRARFTIDELYRLSEGSETMTDKVREMERSWYRSTDSLFTYMAMGDTLHVFPEDSMSLYWYFSINGKISYNGGLIFHASHDQSIPEEYRMKLGRFSIHT